jgi:hypothetical protein
MSDDNREQQAAAGLMGPTTVDMHIRAAIRWCWMTLPSDKRCSRTVHSEIRRLVERALRDLDEDAKAFGIE